LTPFRVGRGTSSSGIEAFIWDASNGMQAIGDLAGGAFRSLALGVSADGSIVVGSGAPGPGGEESSIWDGTNGIQGLGHLSGAHFEGWAFAASADGSIVVGTDFRSFGGYSAFVWDASRGMRNLQVYLTTLGLDLTGWQLSWATGISDDGLTIVGQGINPSGFFEAFIAVIPPPPVPSLSPIGVAVLLSLLGLAAIRRRAS
jgi:MYXO-CTERM domain-containing protein